MLAKYFWIAPDRSPEGGIQGYVRVGGFRQAWFDITPVAAARRGGESAAPFPLGQTGKMKFQVFQSDCRWGAKNLGSLGNGGFSN